MMPEKYKFGSGVRKVTQKSFGKAVRTMRKPEESSPEYDNIKILLTQSEDKYNRMLENLKDEFLFFTHDTKKTFIFLSPSVKNILGYTQEEYKKYSSP